MVIVSKGTAYHKANHTKRAGKYVFFSTGPTLRYIGYSSKKPNKNLNPPLSKTFSWFIKINRVTQLGTNRVETELSPFTDAGFTGGILGINARFSMPQGYPLTERIFILFIRATML